MAIRSFKGKMELAVEEREKSHKQFTNWIGYSLKTCFEQHFGDTLKVSLEQGFKEIIQQTF